MNAKRRGASRSLRVRGPAWLAALVGLAGTVGALVLLFTVPDHLRDSAALDRGPCARGVQPPCAQVDIGRLLEPERGSRRSNTLRWPVSLVQGESVAVTLPDHVVLPVRPGDQVEVWRHDGRPLALVAGGEHFDVGLMGLAGLGALLVGAGLFALLAVAGVAQLLARTSRFGALARGLQLTAVVAGAPLAIALPIIFFLG